MTDDYYDLPVSLELRINGGHYNKLLDFDVRAKGKRPSKVEGAKFDHDVLISDVLSGIIKAFSDKSLEYPELKSYAMDLLYWAEDRLEKD